MKRVFLDTNVLLDYIQQREEFCECAETILRLGYNRRVALLASALSFSNIAYIVRKTYKGAALYEVFVRLRSIINCTTLNENMVDAAIALRAPDFEDALQYYSALGVGADCIVTRNVGDFAFSRIPVLTPAEFVEKM